MAETGRKMALAIGIYLIAKNVLNLILGFSVGNVITLLAAGVIFVLLYKRVPYTNYIIAAYLGILFVAHFCTNIMNLGNGWIYWLYLGEGLLDLSAAVLLAFSKDVKAYYKQ